MGFLGALFIVWGSMSIWLFLLMGSDKKRAVKQAWRTRERTIWLLAVLGGALGGWAGMNVFRHKTKHRAFAFGLPFLSLLHIAGAGYLIGKFYL
ncbi:UNVERIFIED_CONTAM: DUF1294 domain-containing protein [Halobacillus marinus]|uniref:DUF1294 domain-containing protein n=1 Tax=Bacillaceae TaxID=186817 RepID=UPI0002A4E7F8|nr:MULTISPECIES: DUF1294 domain-containing protein [Bacillaceae]ELK47258.1 hypothetical protein D479_07412 [Halobacillus sp. BAB-2008]QHT47374.1 DUF1294 domain-containing protein [Bacillus sp. SB49]